MRIGVLAIQGDFAKHQSVLLQMGLQAPLIRTATELAECDGLIIPGGESTTFTTLIQKHGLWQPLIDFGRQRPIMGTCAGLILLATDVPAHHYPTLGLIEATVIRNAYGRQIDSFIDRITIEISEKPQDFIGIFIRAPKISRVGENVRIIGHHGRDPVMIENERILACTFHPELTDDHSIHQYFVKKISAR